MKIIKRQYTQEFNSLIQPTFNGLFTADFLVGFLQSQRFVHKFDSFIGNSFGGGLGVLMLTNNKPPFQANFSHLFPSYVFIFTNYKMGFTYKFKKIIALKALNTHNPFLFSLQSTYHRVYRSAYHFTRFTPIIATTLLNLFLDVHLSKVMKDTFNFKKTDVTFFFMD